MKTREKHDPAPKVIQRDKDIQKAYSQYWVGYCMRMGNNNNNKQLKQIITVLHPDFIKNATSTDNDDNEVKIFDDNFINECMISKRNSSVILTAVQKNFLNNMAFNSGIHPDQRVQKIRYHYRPKKMSKNKNKNNKRKWIKEKWIWQVITEDNRIFKVDDDWVELNLVYNCRNWYIKQLEPQKLAKSKEETEWKDLPVGSSLKLSPQEDNENVSNTNEKLETDSEIGITQFETTVTHKYLQKDYGDVCTVINLLNLMVYLEDDHAEKKLSPLLNEKDWNKYLKTINAQKKLKVMMFLM